MWERACSRMQCVSQQIHWLIYRIREQARSHMGYWFFTKTGSARY